MKVDPMMILRTGLICGVIAAGLAFTDRAEAQSVRSMPVPTITIYPGEVIKDGVVAERDFSASAVSNLAVVEARGGLVGMVARRTLLPNQLVPRNAVEEPRLVERGKPTQVIFSEAGMTIVAIASPLQSGGLGEMVQARNLDSGVTIVGTVQSDGTLRVGE
jgi:flagellar basal body P-ring formation protein FlgA